MTVVDAVEESARRESRSHGDPGSTGEIAGLTTHPEREAESRMTTFGMKWDSGYFLGHSEDCGLRIRILLAASVSR